MHDRCVDCQASPKFRELQSCFSETFAVKAPNGARVELTLRLCLTCGQRFPDRTALREYLATRLPAYASATVAAVA